MFDAALKLLDEADSFAAIEFLDWQTDPLAVANTYDALMHHLYEVKKDVPHLISLALAGIHYGLAAGHRATDPEWAYTLKSVAKTIAYNLASALWPGWDEPGITLTASDVALGLDVARTNLRLARELDKGDLPLGRAYWLVGAFLLATQRYTDARTAFMDSARHAAAAGAPGEDWLARAYAALADVAQGRDDAELARMLSTLAQQEDGDFFVEQVQTARRVFLR
jgi:hypothetical protein